MARKSRKAPVKEKWHGRFPEPKPDQEVEERREVNIDHLTASDFSDVEDSGLAYSDHDYYGAFNPKAKCSPDTRQFPVMEGLTDQYLNGETTEGTEESGPSADRPISAPASIKKVKNKSIGGQSRSAAEEAHTREMMEAASNVLVPSNATLPPLSGHSVQNQQPDTGVQIRKPGKGDAPLTAAHSPHAAGPRRAISHRTDAKMHLPQEPLPPNPAGVPLAQGSSTVASVPLKKPSTAPMPSPHTQNHGQTAAVQKHVALGRAPGAHAAPPITASDSTTDAPRGREEKEKEAVVSRKDKKTDDSLEAAVPKDVVSARAKGTHATPITASGSTTDAPRRREEKEKDDASEAVVSRAAESAASRDVKNIMQLEKTQKTQRLSTASSQTLLTPRDEKSDDKTRGRQREQSLEQKKRRTSPSKRADQKRIEKESSGDESEEEEQKKKKKKSPSKKASQKHVEKESESSDEDRDEEEKEEEKDWLVTCICGQTEEDEEQMVQCDECDLRWEHVDCIFPRTKTAPEGRYVCHTCQPRPTELTPAEARAYQDRVRQMKESEDQLARQEEEEVKRKKRRVQQREENSRKSSSMTSTATASNNEKPLTSHYRKIEKNEYSAGARRVITRANERHADSFMIKVLKERPSARASIIGPRIYGLFAKENLKSGDYIAELCGHVTLANECSDRDLVHGLRNDQTFPFESASGVQLVIDARNCGNTARFVRRSCKPNAELHEMSVGSDLHVMIKAKKGADINENDEISIGLESGWKRRARPIEGCACKKKKTCEVELFFRQKDEIDESAASSSRRSLPTNGTTPKGDRSPNRRAETEKKEKDGAATKIIAEKDKNQGTINVSRKSKGGASTADQKEKEEKTPKEERMEVKKEVENEEEQREKKSRVSPTRGRPPPISRPSYMNPVGKRKTNSVSGARAGKEAATAASALTVSPPRKKYAAAAGVKREKETASPASLGAVPRKRGGGDGGGGGVREEMSKHVLELSHSLITTDFCIGVQGRQIGRAIPKQLLAREDSVEAVADFVDDGSMLKDEAESMTSDIKDEPIPESGEMELVPTSEEKRMLSGFSVEEMKKEEKEEDTLDQF